MTRLGNLATQMGLGALFPAALILAASAAYANDDLPTILDKCAKASGAESGGAYDCKGVCFTHGTNEDFRFKFSGAQFYDASLGKLRDVAAYDGKSCWVENWSGLPHSVGLVDSDTNEVVAWVMSGEWALNECPITRKITGQTGGELSIEIEPNGGSTAASLVVDSKTMLPKGLSYWTESGDERWLFSDYKQFGKRFLPTRSTHRLSQTTDWYEIDSATPHEATANDFTPPKPDLADTSFDNSKGSRIEMKRILGYMFVHPMVEGKDMGWFFLDSGADVMCIDPKVADSLQMDKIGADTTAGVVAVTKLGIVRGKSFELGPVTIKSPTFYAFDMSPFQVFGIKIAGICGYDFIGRTELRIDPRASKIDIYEPEKMPPSEAVRWEPVTFNGDTPCIQCSFEGGRTGTFSLDTGSGSNVDLFSPIVAKLGLLSGRKTGSVRTGGAGGSADSKMGQIAFFEVGGHRFENPTVGLQVTKEGVFASPYLAGNVGMGFLGHFDLVFDYSRSRIGFAYSN